MAFRRAFLTVALLAATLLVLLPAAAMAAQWLPGESREASDALSTPPRVAADAGGNSVAVWLGAGGEVNAAFRPRGGPWGGAENLETEFVVTSGVAPRVAAMPNGEFVAAWLADDGEGSDALAHGDALDERRVERAGHRRDDRVLPGHRGARGGRGRQRHGGRDGRGRADVLHAAGRRGLGRGRGRAHRVRQRLRRRA